MPDLEEWLYKDECSPWNDNVNYYITVFGGELTDYMSEGESAAQDAETLEGSPMLSDGRDWQYQIEDDKGLKGSEQAVSGNLTVDFIADVVLKIVAGTSNVGDTFKVSQIGHGKYDWKTHTLTKQVLEYLSEPISQTKKLNPGELKDRFIEAALEGATKLLKFYGKLVDGEVYKKLAGHVSIPEYHVFDSELLPFKVLISVNKAQFDLLDDDPTACNIDVPDEPIITTHDLGYINPNEIVQKIALVVQGVEEYILPELEESDIHITNVNIELEMEFLTNLGSKIQKYIDYNQLTSKKLDNPECSVPTEIPRTITFGFDKEYKCRYTLVDDTEQHTIGYECLINASELNHITSVNYLTRLDAMIAGLQTSDFDDFSAFEFLYIHTLPEIIMELKDKPSDGTNEYDKDGERKQPQPTRGPSCKTNVERDQETQRLNNPVSKAEKAKAAQETTENVGPQETTPSAINESLNMLGGTNTNTKTETQSSDENKDVLDPIQTTQNKEAIKGAEAKATYIFGDLLAKINMGDLLQQTLPVMLRSIVHGYGKSVYEDPELKEAFQLQRTKYDKLKTQASNGNFKQNIGFPKMQDITLPTALPVGDDFFKPAMDQLRAKLIDTLVSAAVSNLTETFRNVLDFNYTNPGALLSNAQGNKAFKKWLSETAGISMDDMLNPEVFSSVLAKHGGKGFSGIISNILSKRGSPERWEIAGYTLSDLPVPDGIPLTIKDANVGTLKEKYLSREDLIGLTSEISTGVDELDAVLKPEEFQSLLKGRAPNNVVDLATKVLTRNASHDGIVFKTKEDVVYVMSSIGKMLDSSFLTSFSDDLTPYLPLDPSKLTEEGAIPPARKLFLETTQPYLTNSEIDEIIEKEKQRKKKRILKTVDILNKYTDGTMLPPVPDLLGENGLMDDLPPVVTKTADSVIKSVLDPVNSTFLYSIEGDLNSPGLYTASYGSWWGKTLSTKGYLLNEPKELYNSFSIQSSGDASNYSLTMGYSQNNTATEVTQGTKDIQKTGRYVVYEFGKLFSDPDTVYDKDDVGELFDKMKKEFDMGEDYKKWYENNIVEFIQDNHMEVAGELQEELFSDPYNTERAWQVEVRESVGGVTILEMAVGEEDSSILYRDEDHTDDIIKISVKADQAYTKLEYKSDNYRISSNLSSLGQKRTEGDLITRNYNSLFFTNIAAQNLDINLETLEDPAEVIESKWVSNLLVQSFVYYINANKYWDRGEFSNTYENGFASKFEFSSADIFDLEEIKQSSSELVGTILRASLSGEYCDSCSEIKRLSSINALRMMIRLFIVEQALTSPQVFNNFHLGFMQDTLFVVGTYNLFKNEIQGYQQQFPDLETAILKELKNAAIKYYEILNLAGQDVEIPDEGREAIIQMIRSEIVIMQNSITKSLFGGSELTTTLDHHITTVLFGDDEEEDWLRAPEDKEEIRTDLKKPGGVIYGHKSRYSNFLAGELKETGEQAPTFIFTRTKANNNDAIKYSYNLLYLKVKYYERSKNLTTTELEVMDIENILSVECDKSSQPENETEIYEYLRDLMFQSDEFQRIFHEMIPVGSLMAALSMYQYSALSDDSTFGLDPGRGESGKFDMPYVGFELKNMLSQTKLSVLQLFAAAIYSDGKIDYQDPFLQKAKQN